MCNLHQNTNYKYQIFNVYPVEKICQNSDNIVTRLFLKFAFSVSLSLESTNIQGINSWQVDNQGEIFISRRDICILIQKSFYFVDDKTSEGEKIVRCLEKSRVGGAISVNKKRKICADYILSQVWSSFRATQWSVDFRGIILCLRKRKRWKRWLRKVKVVGNQLFVESTSICHQDNNYNTGTKQICNKITGRWLDRSQPLFYFVPHALSRTLTVKLARLKVTQNDAKKRT